MGHPGIPTLITARLVLRPFVPEDLDELAAIHAEESFWWYPLRAAMSREETAVERVGDGRFTALVHPDWEIWGPCGGYVAALALRAAGAESPLARPASFFCHYLSAAAFAPVELEVTPLRTGRTVLAQRVAMSQEGRPVLEAMVWSVGEVQGLEHED